MAVDEQRLLAEAVARQQQAAAALVPEGEREHAVERVHELRAVLLVEVDEHLGVRAAAEGVPALLEQVAQLAVVVDLAVQRRPHVARLVGERLVAAGDVDHAEAPRAERDASPRVLVDAFVVGAAMRLRRVHRAHRSRPVVPGRAADPAHATESKHRQRRCVVAGGEQVAHERDDAALLTLAIELRQRTRDGRAACGELAGVEPLQQLRERRDVALVPRCVARQPPQPAVVEVVGQRDLARDDRQPRRQVLAAASSCSETSRRRRRSAAGWRCPSPRACAAPRSRGTSPGSSSRASSPPSRCRSARPRAVADDQHAHVVARLGARRGSARGRSSSRSAVPIQAADEPEDERVGGNPELGARLVRRASCGSSCGPPSRRP